MAGDPPASVPDIIWQAILDWEAVLEGPELTVTFVWTPEALGATSRVRELSNCCPGDTIICISGERDWYFDPQPENRDEYDGAGHARFCSYPAPGKPDLRTVVAHELGHVFGFAIDDLNPGYRLVY